METWQWPSGLFLLIINLMSENGGWIVIIIQQNMWRKLAAFSASARLKLSFFYSLKSKRILWFSYAFIFCLSSECNHIINFLLSKPGRSIRTNGSTVATVVKRYDLIDLKGQKENLFFLYLPISNLLFGERNFIFVSNIMLMLSRNQGSIQ